MINYHYFKGRMNRKDFIIGMFFFNFLFFLVYTTPLLFFFQKYTFQEFVNMDRVTATLEIGNYFNIHSATGIFFNIFGLLIILASLGVCVRRFHDVGRTGKLVALVPLAFIIRMFFAHLINYFLTHSIQPSPSDLILFKFSDYLSLIVYLIFVYLTIQKGQEHKNRYGEVPVNGGLKKIIFN